MKIQLLSSFVNLQTKEKVEDLEVRDLTITRNAKVLTEEGFKTVDVRQALTLSRGKLDLARRLLQLVKDEHGKILYSYFYTMMNLR